MTEISLPDRMAIQDLLTEFGWLVDHGEAGKVAELFTENGKLVTPMFTLEGKESIARQFGERAKDTSRLSRHIWTNLRLEVLDARRIKASMAVQTYVANGVPPVSPQDIVVGDSLDIVEKGDDGVWRFSERQLVIVFKFGGGA